MHENLLIVDLTLQRIALLRPKYSLRYIDLRDIYTYSVSCAVYLQKINIDIDSSCSFLEL